ncbi:MAG: DUF4440 domain-containing protein [Alphaproteobacteria bacterium]|nr:DUF4440 domain-containing protein [Alphaproteobacteria bacterium]
MSSCCSTCCCSNQEPIDEVGIKEVRDVLDVWLKAISTGTPDAVMTLYSEYSVLLPTLAPIICDTYEKRLEYFTSFTANEDLKGYIDDVHTRVHGDLAINSGHYTFTFKKDGKEVSVSARFSFVYKKKPLGWMIIDHHSSIQPSRH